MAHFAKLDADNVVIELHVVNDEDCQDEDGNESEAVGVAFLQGIFGSDTIWKQTSYNDNIRTRYAQIGGTYDTERDAFINAQPFASWTLNTTTLDWDAPVALPAAAETTPHYWDEENQQWQIAAGVE